MAFLDFLKSKPDEESSAVEGALPLDNSRLENSESAETLRTAKRGNSKKSESGNGTFALENGNSGKDVLADAAKALDALLDPKIWKGAVSAPADAMVAITGRKHWELSDDEKDTLAKTGAATARCFMVTDPKWLALSLFSFSIISIYGSRIIKDLKEKSEAKKNKLPESK